MLASITTYGLSRLYFELTGGFTLGNIHSELPYKEEREVSALPDEALTEVRDILSREYRYLGKGCQSYVFLSSDGKYVIKFLKYQRFRPQGFLNYLSFIPQLNRYRLKKIDQKQEKLDRLFDSWKIAYQNLSNETGLVFLHLNKSSNLKIPLIIYDKMGLRHELNPDQLEFLVQKRADMLCPVIERYMQNNDLDGAKMLLTKLVDMVLSEYQRGFADNDHALMQNTGVFEGSPVHIDVGQFVQDEKMKEKEIYELELFSKTYKFRIWLGKRYPELEDFLASRLLEIIGPKMHSMKPRLKTVDEGA